ARAARPPTAASGSSSAFISSGFAAAAFSPVSHSAEAAAWRTFASGSDRAFAMAETASGFARPPSHLAAETRSFGSRSFASFFANSRTSFSSSLEADCANPATEAHTSNTKTPAVRLVMALPFGVQPTKGRAADAGEARFHVLPALVKLHVGRACSADRNSA